MNSLRPAASCLLAVAALASTPVTAAELSDDWQFQASINGWFPDIAGTTAFGVGDGRDFGVDIGTILDNLEFTLQGSFAVQKGKWGAFTDLVYMDVSASKSGARDFTLGGLELPASVSAGLDLDLTTTIWTVAGSYRLQATPGSNLDLLAGVRLFDTDSTLGWNFSGDFGPIAPPPLTGEAGVSASNWDAIVGIKGNFGLGAESAWSVPFYADVGTGDSDLTWQALLGLTYSFNWGDVGVAWRYMEYQLASGEKINDMNFNGPALGVTFRW